MPFQSIFFYSALGILALAFLIQIFWRKKTLTIIRPLFWLAVFAVLGYLLYISYLQYLAFSEGPLGLTLGTESGFRWFLGYVRMHFWNEYLVSLLGAVIVFLFAKYMNKRKGGIFMEPEEIYLGALGAFLVGYPGWIFYIVIVLVLSAIAAAIFLKKNQRIPLYHLWIPTAIVTLIAIQFWASSQGWWVSFRF